MTSPPEPLALSYIIMILHSYVEQVLIMCHVQEGQLLLLFFRSYFPLIVSDAISCLLHNLNTLCYIIIIFICSWWQQGFKFYALLHENMQLKFSYPFCPIAGTK